MTRTSAKDLSEMLGTGRRTDFSPRKSRGMSDSYRNSPFRKSYASTSSAGPDSPSGASGYSYASPYGSPLGSPVGRGYTPGQPKGYVPSRLGAVPVGFRESYASDSPYTPNAPQLHSAINRLEPRYSVPIPDDPAIRAAVSPASPPVMPSAFYKTQQSLWQFMESPMRSPDSVLPERLFSSPQKPRLPGKGTTRNMGTERKTKKSSFEKLVEKTCSRCSSCGALGHRYHLAGCRFGTMASIL